MKFLFKHEALFYVVGGIFSTALLSLIFSLFPPFGLTLERFLFTFKWFYYLASGYIIIHGVIGLIYPKYMKGNNIPRSAAIHYLGMLIAYVAKYDYASAGIISAICLAFAFNIGVSDEDD